MDGVPLISQAPIPPDQLFIYEYPILQSGTYWYHSHFGFQEQMGLGGPFIIEPKNEPLHYDRDYVIFLSDWLHADPWQVFYNLRKKAKKETPAMKMPQGPDLVDVRYNALSAKIEALLTRVLGDQHLTALMVTHGFAQAGRIANRAVLIDAGSLIVNGTVQEVLHAESTLR